MIQHKLYRQHCEFEGGVFIKNLERLGRQLKDTIILDNSPLSYMKQTKNGIPIRSWYSDKKDKDLFSLIPILVNLSKFYDVTTELPKFVNNNTLIFSKAYLWFNENRMELDANTNNHLNLIAENFNIKPKNIEPRSNSQKNTDSSGPNANKQISSETRNDSKMKAPNNIQKQLITKLLTNGGTSTIIDALSTKNTFVSLLEKSKLKKVIQPSKKEMHREDSQKSSCAVNINPSVSHEKDLLVLPSDLNKKRKKQNSDIIHENRSSSKKVVIKVKEDSAQTTKHSIANTLYNLKYSIAQDTPCNTNTLKPGNLKYQSINCFRMNESLSTKNFNLKKSLMKAESKQKSESFNFNFNTFNSFCGGTAIPSTQTQKKQQTGAALEININSISSIIQGNPSKTSTFKMQSKHKASVSLVAKDFNNTTTSKIGANDITKANQNANADAAREVETRSQQKLKSHSINIKKASVGVKLIESPVKSRN